MKYGRCECGGKIVERRIKYLRRFRGQLFEFDNVPVGVCMECGERIFKGTVLERLEQLTNQRQIFRKKRVLSVGVYTL
ncbi:MAG: YgiT-type zinc finger protein [Planctomycetota bacterium]